MDDKVTGRKEYCLGRYIIKPAWEPSRGEVARKKQLTINLLGENIKPKYQTGILNSYTTPIYQTSIPSQNTNLNKNKPNSVTGILDSNTNFYIQLITIDLRKRVSKLMETTDY